MHSWERAFDGVNSLSDKLSVNKWHITDETDKDAVSAWKERKKRMHDEFGLLVDTPRAGVPARLTPATLPAKLSRTSQSLLRFLASTQS